jgi:hypothetical protein
MMTTGRRSLLSFSRTKLSAPFSPDIGNEVRGPARIVLGQVCPEISKDQGGGDIDKPFGPSRLGQDFLDEVDRRFIYPGFTLDLRGLVRNDGGRVDDIIKVPGQFEAPGIAEIPENRLDGEILQEMEVGSFHQPIDIIPLARPAAEIEPIKPLAPVMKTFFQG